MNLSKNFTLAELTVSDWASRNNIDNTPPGMIEANMKMLAEKLEEVRAVLGQAVYVNSGYRSPKVNKAIGGKPTSSHQYGLAADIRSPYGDPMAVCSAIEKSGIKFDQLILEFPTPEGGGWTHIGIGAQMRQQILTINSQGAFTGLHM